MTEFRLNDSCRFRRLSGQDSGFGTFGVTQEKLEQQILLHHCNSVAL